MSTRIYINGTITPPEGAKISVFDRGFLYGDSVYEVMRSCGGQLVDLERHVTRLGRSAQALALPLPERDKILDAVAQTLKAADNVESYVRIVLTRGEGEVGLATDLAINPTLLVIAKPLVLPTAEMYNDGVKVRLVGVQRTSAKAVDPSVKSGNYLNNIMALAEARKSGDYEAIMCDRDGWVAEGSSSNLFIWQAGRLRTPSLSVGLLAGITRRRVLELATSRGLEVEEGRMRPQEIRDADEAFLTSSIRGILPISYVDGEVIAPPESCRGPSPGS
ncbi:MAG: aminotransferase class IV [Kofleriaceae bacterium]|nr:aminotransferase class IV [Kofleriaceae bacterium]